MTITPFTPHPADLIEDLSHLIDDHHLGQAKPAGSSAPIQMKAGSRG